MINISCFSEQKCKNKIHSFGDKFVIFRRFVKFNLRRCKNWTIFKDIGEISSFWIYFIVSPDVLTRRGCLGYSTVTSNYGHFNLRESVDRKPKRTTFCSGSEITVRVAWPLYD